MFVFINDNPMYLIITLIPLKNLYYEFSFNPLKIKLFFLDVPIQFPSNPVQHQKKQHSINLTQFIPIKKHSSHQMAMAQNYGTNDPQFNDHV